MKSRVLIAGAMIAILAGCAGPNSTARNVQTGATLNALAGVPGAGIVGLAAMAVDVVSGALSSSDMDGGETRSKQFTMSKKLADALSNDPGVMTIVLDSQEKFKRGNGGKLLSSRWNVTSRSKEVKEASADILSLANLLSLLLIMAVSTRADSRMIPKHEAVCAFHSRIAFRQ